MIELTISELKTMHEVLMYVKDSKSPIVQETEPIFTSVLNTIRQELRTKGEEEYINDCEEGD